jgi:hypothetical protein
MLYCKWLNKAKIRLNLHFLLKETTEALKVDALPIFVSNFKQVQFQPTHFGRFWRELI